MTAMAKEFQERLDAFDLIMDDPKERGKFLIETIHGTVAAAKEDKAEDKDGLNIVGLLLKKLTG